MADRIELTKMLKCLEQYTDGDMFVNVMYAGDPTNYVKPAWTVEETVAKALRGVGEKAKYISCITNGSEVLYSNV